MCKCFNLQAKFKKNVEYDMWDLNKSKTKDLGILGPLLRNNKMFVMAEITFTESIQVVLSAFEWK